MKKAILFKTLVDILYFFLLLGLIGVLFIIPMGTYNINQVGMNVENWNLFSVLVSALNAIAYIIVLRGLYFLRKMAIFLLSNRHFSGKISTNLKKSGNNFLVAGVISFTLSILIWLNKLYGGKLELTFDTNLLVPLFLMIIGMFFVIQSNTLDLAKEIKEENELTV